MQVFAREFPHIDPVEQDPALIRVVNARNQLDQRRLARAVLPASATGRMPSEMYDSADSPTPG